MTILYLKILNHALKKTKSEVTIKGIIKLKSILNELMITVIIHYY